MRRENKKKKNNHGFSLVELIIVIAIMAILIGIFAPAFIKYVNKSKKQTDITNAGEIQNEIEVSVTSEGITSGALATTHYVEASTEVSSSAVAVSSVPDVKLKSGERFYYKVEINGSGDPTVHVAIASTAPGANDHSKDIVPECNNTDYNK